MIKLIAGLSGIITCLILIGGCSKAGVGNQLNNYRTAKLTRSVHIPPHLQQPLAIRDLYPIPSRNKVHGPLITNAPPPNLSS